MVETTGCFMPRCSTQVVHQQAHDLELVDEGAPLIRGTRAVGVAVEQQPEVVATLRKDAQGLVDVGPDGLRVDAPEPGVALGVDLGHPDPAARQQPADPAGATAPQRVHEDRHVGRLEALEVEAPADVVHVARVRVEALHQARRLRIRDGPRRRRPPRVVPDDPLDDREDVRAGRGARG